MDIEAIIDSKVAPTIQVYYFHFALFKQKRENEIKKQYICRRNKSST